MQLVQGSDCLAFSLVPGKQEGPAGPGASSLSGHVEALQAGLPPPPDTAEAAQTKGSGCEGALVRQGRPCLGL